MGIPPLPRVGYFEVIPPDPAVLTYRQPVGIDIQFWVAAAREIEAECYWPPGLYTRREIRYSNNDLYFDGILGGYNGGDRYPGESEPPPALPAIAFHPYSVIHPQSVVET